MENAAFIWERRDTVCEVLDRLASAGSVQPLASLLPIVNNYLYLFDEHDLRRRLSDLVAAATSDGRMVSAASRLLTLIEGEGWILWQRREVDVLKARILSPEIEERDLPEALLRAQHGEDGDEVRRALVAQCVLRRLKGLVADDPRTALEEFQAGARLAWQARHESLAVSIAVDSAERMAQQGHGEDAANRLFWAERCATRQGNDRRLFRVYCVQARLAATRGDVPQADARLRLAENVLERFALIARILLPGAQRPDWYQPGYRGALEALRAEIGPMLDDARRSVHWATVTDGDQET